MDENIEFTDAKTFKDGAIDNSSNDVTLAMLKAFAATREKWEKKEDQQILLRAIWGYGLLFIFSLQILILLYLVYFSITKSIELTAGFNIYITGVFVESLVLPKQIAENLFPKTETNNLLEIFNSLNQKKESN